MTPIHAAPASSLTVAEDEITVQRDKPRIVVADDQEDVLRTVAGILHDEFHIVGMARNGKEALDVVLNSPPNVLVLDIVMPLLNGIETACRVKASGSPIAVIIFSVHEDREFFEAAVSAGALGYVHKPHMTDLIPAIWTVLDGEFYVSPSLHLY
jgi:DNA-binding NarL/FixJ family response regulator